MLRTQVRAYSCTSSNSNTSVDKVLPGPVQQLMLCYSCRVRIKRLHRSSPSTTPFEPFEPTRRVLDALPEFAASRFLPDAWASPGATMSDDVHDVRRCPTSTDAHVRTRANAMTWARCVPIRIWELWRQRQGQAVRGSVGPFDVIVQRGGYRPRSRLPNSGPCPRGCHRFSEFFLVHSWPAPAVRCVEQFRTQWMS